MSHANQQNDGRAGGSGGNWKNAKVIKQKRPEFSGRFCFITYKYFLNSSNF